MCLVAIILDSAHLQGIFYGVESQISAQILIDISQIPSSWNIRTGGKLTQLKDNPREVR
jgi:hypothetical protein